MAWNVAQGLPGKSPVPADERSRMRSEIGQRMFGEQYGREALNSRELAGFITRASRGEKQVCAGYDVTFTMPKSVSALWAVSPRPVAEQIENAHRTAVTVDCSRFYGHGFRRRVRECFYSLVRILQVSSIRAWSGA